MPFWDTILDTVISNAPSIVSTVGDIIGNDEVTDGNDAAAAAVGEGYAEADEIYQGAYDEALGYQLDALGLDAETEADRLAAILPFISSLRDDYNTEARISGQLYGDRVMGGAEDYAGRVAGAGQLSALDILAGGENFAGDMREASDTYDERLAGAAGGYRDEIRGGFKTADGMFVPYTDEGTHALDLLRGITARDPSEMDPSQRRMRERSIDDMRANLASSGLRGAGRAGVAAMNEGIADLDANIHDANRARIDQAIQTLSSLGYNATGQRAGLATGAADRIARNDMSAAELSARTRMSADDLAARTRLGTLERASDRLYDANREGAGRVYDATRDAALGDLRIDDAVIQNTAARGDQALDVLNNFYTGRGSRGMSEADARTWATMGQADSAATAAAGTQFARGQAETANARANASTIGSVTNTIGNLLRSTTRDRSAPTFSPAT